jgi:signal transduction histidine kinase
VSVADNGRGIPHEDLPILFDKFYRGEPALRSAAAGSSKNGADYSEDADASGIGLGLYVAANVMEKMDGRISVETEVGCGSTFTLHLPVCAKAGCMRRLKEREEDDGTIAGC